MLLLYTFWYRISCLSSFWQLPMSSYLPLRLCFLLYKFWKGITPIFCLRCSKDSLGSGLVKMSATCSFVSTYSSLTTFWDTCSLRKWYFIGICYVLECMTRLLDIFMELVLSQFIIIGFSYFISKSSSVCFIQMTWMQHDASTIYSASVVESEMEVCFLLNHGTK